MTPSDCVTHGLPDKNVDLLACNHLCIPIPNGKTCFCPSGAYLEASSGSCIKGEHQINAKLITR